MQGCKQAVSLTTYKTTASSNTGPWYDLHKEREGEIILKIVNISGKMMYL